MADEADITGDSERERFDSLSGKRARCPLQGDGYCLYCGESITSGLFCDSDCWDDYTNRARANLMKPVY